MKNKNIDKNAIDLVNQMSEGKILTKCEKCGKLHIENLKHKGLFMCACGGKTWMSLVVKNK